MKKSHSKDGSWFRVRRSLSSRTGRLLKLFSFILPLGLWVLVSYVPFIWHPDIALDLSADRSGSTTVFTAGDHLSKEYYASFVTAIREENVGVLQKRKNPESVIASPKFRRSNLKIIRHFRPIAVANGWLSAKEAESDANLFAVWGKVARGEYTDQRRSLSLENKEIIIRNWELMSQKGNLFEAKKLPLIPLEKLVPQGRPSNPVYLPAPDQVWQRFKEDFGFFSESDRSSMMSRYGHSLKIVFLGFLFSAVLGIPLGILCGTFDFFSKLVEPFVDFFRYMPAPAFSTLLVAVFLAHDAPKVALVFLGTFFQMVLVVANTTRRLDYGLLEAAQTLGAKGFGLIRKVIIPGITPSLYNDMRILLGWAWTWLVIAELIGVKSGLTEFIETQGRWRNFDRVYPVIILIGLTGFFTDQILASWRKYFFPWTAEAAQENRGILGRFFSWLLDRNYYYGKKSDPGNRIS